MYFIVALIPFFIVFLCLIIYTHINRDKDFVKSVVNLKLSIKVDSVFYDKSNHRASTILTKSGNKILNEYFANINDSIVKNENDSFFYIYRGDSVLKFNLLQMYRETGWLD